MLIHWITLVASVTLACSAPVPPGRRPSPQCDPGEEDDCAKCYDALANELIISDRNRFTLQQSFFPPDAENPVFIEVRYVFTRNLTGDGTTDYDKPGPSETWYWTTSSSYLFQPIESLQFTSLLFSDPQIRSTNISLYLQPRCQNSSIEMKTLLTHRLKIYAMHQSIAADIDDSYHAQGQSVVTIGLFHLGNATELYPNQHVTSYTFSLHFILPVFAFAFIVLLFYHVIEKRDLFETRSGMDERHNERHNHFYSAKASSTNLQIMTMALSSVSFVIYVLVLDCLALNHWFRLGEEEIFYNPRLPNPVDEMVSTNKLERDIVSEKLRLEFGIPWLMLMYDLITLFLLIGFIMSIRFQCWAPKWNYITIAPLSCIGTHLYHIMLGFIHNPKHATSIAVFYGIVISVYIGTIRISYVALYSCYNQLQRKKIKDKDSEQNKGNKLKYFGRIDNCITAHKRPHLIVLLLLSVTSVFVACFIVYFVVLFVINPVNNAIEGAPNSLISINQTALIFLGAAVTYKIIQDEKSTTISLFVNAMNSATNYKHNPIKEDSHSKLVEALSNQSIQKAALELFETATGDLIEFLTKILPLGLTVNEANLKVQNTACVVFRDILSKFVKGDFELEYEDLENVNIKPTLDKVVRNVPEDTNPESNDEVEQKYNDESESDDKLDDVCEELVKKTILIFPKIIHREISKLCDRAVKKLQTEQYNYHSEKLSCKAETFIKQFLYFTETKDLSKKLCSALIQKNDKIWIANTRLFKEPAETIKQLKKSTGQPMEVKAIQTLAKVLAKHKKIGRALQEKIVTAVEAKLFLGWDSKSTKQKIEAICLYFLDKLKRFPA